MVFLSPPLVNHGQHSKTSCALMLYLSCCKCKNPNLKEKWKFLIYLTPSKAGPGFRPSQMSICMTIFISLSSPALHFSLLLLFSLSVMSDSLRPWSLQHARLPCPFLSPGVCWNSCPLSWWYHPTISSSVVPFSSCCPRSFPASELFPIRQLFASGCQSIGATASASVLPGNIQGLFPLGLIGLISLQSKGLSRVFSNITVQKHKFFGAQTSLWSNSHICTWLLKKP